MAYDEHRYLTIQGKRIDELKWLRSEDEGRDIGMPAAVIEWNLSHAAEFNEAFTERQDSIDARCDSNCGKGTCRGAEKCPYTNKELYELLYK
ncbi:DUF4032 domain-containing protein [Candidatus Woesearchaeota archaeon]|nr:DUF4032 domain-containing protein [Candidatus Woesearchaeota archaeon]